MADEDTLLTGQTNTDTDDTSGSDDSSTDDAANADANADTPPKTGRLINKPT